MRGVFLLAVAAGAVWACGFGHAEDQGAGGRLVFRKNSSRVLNAPAVARVCERDTTVAVLAVSESWGAALGVRSVWPPASGDSFPIAASLDSPRTASVALRRIGEGVAPALTASSGVLRLESGGGLSGAFEGSAVDTAGNTIRLSGSLRAIPVVTGACP